MGTRIAYTSEADFDKGEGAPIFMANLSPTGTGPARIIGRHSNPLTRVTFHPDGRRLVSADTDGAVRFWDLGSKSQAPVRVLHQPKPRVTRNLRFDPTGTLLVTATWARYAGFWNLIGPPASTPTLLRRGESWFVVDAAIHPKGDWVATAGFLGLSFYPITRPFPLHLAGHEGAVRAIEFLPNGEGLVSGSGDGTLRLWPMSQASGDRSRVLLDTGNRWLKQISVDPSGERMLVGAAGVGLWLVSTDGSAVREVEEIPGGPDVALGSHHAVGLVENDQGEQTLRVWNLETDETRDLEPDTEIRAMTYLQGDRLLVVSPDGLRELDLTTGSTVREVELKGENREFQPASFSADGRIVLMANKGEDGEAVLFDLDAGTRLQLDSHGPNRCGDVDPGGRFVVTYSCEPGGRGQLLIGSINGDPPHLLVSDETFSGQKISPDGRWIATTAGDDDPTITLWPVPDLSRPPLHTLPLDRLLSKLRALTNLRVVPDPESDTGWSWALDPFPGWEEVPTW